MNNIAKHYITYSEKVQGKSIAELSEILPEYLAPDIEWKCSHPFNEINGLTATIKNFWQPFVHAFPDWQRRIEILFSQGTEYGDWVVSSGHFVATFKEDFLGIPANDALVNIRFGEFSQFKDGKFVKTTLQLDLLNLLYQLDALPLKNNSGTNPWVPAPLSDDGVKLTAQNQQESDKSMQLVNDMLDGLMRYDHTRGDLEHMDQHLFWAPNMMWYGPTGIGSTRGLYGFRKYHQRPFLTAFPDRKGGYHDVRMAAGNYAATCGWPSLLATHKGEYLGIPATGKKVSMRVMDLWCREDNYLVENWVFIDLPDLLLQLGYDVLSEGIKLLGN